jgi:hypothetical protein
MRKVVVGLFSLSVLAMWILASQIWAETGIVDSSTRVSITGLEAYPQLTFILVAWTLILAIGRYVKAVFGKFLISAVSILLFATAAPVWFESASGSLAILSPQISRTTGVSDWQSQSNLLSDSFYNHLSADLFVIALIVGFASSLVYLWMGLSRPGAASFSTRIDKLPSW